jgi:eukaryotic-like serine/threonine-protein kinase
VSQDEAQDEAQRYRLDTRIATGGMGEVWQGTDTLLERKVAIKVLKSEYADDDTFRTRFESEARNAAALHHPNVAAVLDFGTLPADDGRGPGTGTGCPFLVMELVPGQPLSALLRGGDPMPPATAAALMAQAADAVAAAHALDIVHRDIKPANLLVTPQRAVKITDFGIARASDGAALTLTGEILGTPQYLSPEQAEGRPATWASDIYSLGVVLFECLAGARPFGGDTPVATALAHLREPVPPLPEAVPAHLRAVVEAALAKDPEDRFSSAAEMATALRGGPVPVPVTRAITTTAGSRPGWHRPWVAWVTAGVAVLLVAWLVSTLGGGTPVSVATSPSVSPSVTEQAVDHVQIHAEDYLGMPAAAAKGALEKLGLRVREKPWANTGGHPRGTVGRVSPTGRVLVGDTITLDVWAAPPAPKPVTHHRDGSKTGHSAHGHHQGHGHKGHGHKHGETKGK